MSVTRESDSITAFLNARLAEDEARARARATAHPARALREVEAKRRLIERYERAAAVPESVSSFKRGASVINETGIESGEDEFYGDAYVCCGHCDHDEDEVHTAPCEKGCNDA